MGMINGLGHNLNEAWSNAIEGKSGISLIDSFDTEHLGTKFAGVVKNFSIAEDILPAKETARYDRFIHFALHSADEAIKHAGLKGQQFYDPTRMGCILGVGIGGLPEIERTMVTMIEKGPKRVSPFFIPAIIPNMTKHLFIDYVERFFNQLVLVFHFVRYRLFSDLFHLFCI